jgi:uncharacterized membrane protein YhaH (DUF805 family)
MAAFAPIAEINDPRSTNETKGEAMSVFEGRMNRASYWASLVIVLVMLAALSFAFKTQFKLQEVVLAFFCVPRLHDIGKSGWYFMVGFALELAGVIVSASFLHGSDVELGMGLTVIGVAGLLIWLGCISGQAKANEFGDPPLPGVHLGARKQK